MCDHIESEPTVDKVDGSLVHISRLGPIGEVNAGLSILGGVGDIVKMVVGIEGRVEIKITNRLSDSLEIHFHSGKDKETKEVLKSGLTRFFSKKPKDGFIHTSNYECEFRYQNKYARIYVYGERAPRKDNLIEVREEGFFLIDQSKELKLADWDKADEKSN